MQHRASSLAALLLLAVAVCPPTKAAPQAQAGSPAKAAPAGQAHAPVADAHTLLLAHFDTSLDADMAKGSPTAEVTGAELVQEGKWGGAVKLSEGRYLGFDPTGNLDMSAGSLAFWVKPSWDAASADSHALLSMGLDGDPAGYFALSQGWWEEGGGAGRMYFIYDNQAYMHASTSLLGMLGGRLNEWHQIVLTWREGQAGRPGQATVYVDGEQAAQTVKGCGQVRRPRTRLFVGSDAASGMAGTRPADVLLDELVITDRALSPSEVAAAFRAQEPRWAEIQARKWAWLTEVLRGPAPVVKRDRQGRVSESRAMLDELWNWARHETADEIVAKLKRAGFNVYIPCVWHGRGTHWPSRVEAPAPELAPLFDRSNRDPLTYLIERCHENGIQVHPWFCVSLRQADLYPEFREEGTPDQMFDAHRPAFRDFIVEMMLEVVRQYPVDGLNLDYIRTGGVCTGPKCQAEYEAKFGTKLPDDLKLPGEKGAPNPRIVQWQDEAIGDIVRRLAAQGRKIRPSLIISADVHVGAPDEPPAVDGRNVLPWLKNGWVNVLYDMDYGRVLSHQRLTAARRALSRPEAIVALLGNYEVNDAGKVIPREGKLLANQLSYCQRRWPGNGVGVYLYGMLSEEQIKALRAGPFKADAVPYWVR